MTVAAEDVDGDSNVTRGGGPHQQEPYRLGVGSAVTNESSDVVLFADDLEGDVLGASSDVEDNLLGVISQRLDHGGEHGLELGDGNLSI